MQLNLEFDSSTASAPASFFAAIQSAASIIDATFSDPITINLAVGYGEVTLGGVTTPLTNGSAAAGAEALSGVNYLFNYAATRSLLVADLASDVAAGALALPATTRLQGSSKVVIWSAEQKALGLMSPTDGGLDGAAGFATDIPASLLVGVALHELTHAMGRLSTDSTSLPDIFDLDRFTSSGTRLFGHNETAPLSYFSLDGGNTALAYYGENSDPSDYLNAPDGQAPYNNYTPNDPLNEYYNARTTQAFSQVDLLQMEALGFHVQHTAPTVSAGFDQVSDVLFRNNATGDWGYLTVGANDAQGWHPLGLSAAAYSVQGLGDFNGDHVSDVLFRNNSSGDWGYLSLGSNDAQGWHPLGTSHTGYSVAGVGDFNGDGRSEVLFRDNSSGDWGYLTIGANDAQGWHHLGTSNTAYSVAGVGDINGDGHTDVIFRDNGSGDWGYLTIGANDVQGWHPLGVSNTAYSVAGVGDFNGDGRADIAFRDGAGDWGYIGFSGSDVQSWHHMGALSPSYAVVGVGDYNSDGYSDLLFRNDSTGAWGYMAVTPLGETWHSLGASNTGYIVV